MVRTFLYIFLVSLALPATTLSVLAQADTAMHQLKGVEIFGKPAEVYAVGSRVSSIDSSYLHHHASGSLANALQALTPLYLKSYGASGISSVSFRGTNASQTAVLWNGLNISSPTLGQTDFSTLPVSSFGEVAIQYGSAGANYGNGAIGGAVLLNSPVYSDKGWGAAIHTEAGSFGHYFGSGRIHYGNQKLQANAGAYYRQAANNFKYRDLTQFQTPEVRQHNASAASYGFTQNITWHVKPATKIAFHNWYTSADREVQPAMGSAANDAKLQDTNLRLMATLEHSSNWGETNIKAAYFNDFLRYTNTSVNSVSDVTTYQLQTEQTYSQGKQWSLHGGINLQHFIAENDGYAGTQKESRASAFALFRYDPVETLKLSFNLRQAFIEGYNPNPTPSIGLEWKFYNHPIHRIFLKGNTAGSYRVPTLNDRFWVGSGNPDLKPEHGWNFESGLLHQFTPGNNFHLSSEITAYYMLIDDWIQWRPDDAGRWRPVNLMQVISKGIEAHTKATFETKKTKLSTMLAYTYTSSEQTKVYEGTGDRGKQLMYVPRHKAIFTTEMAYQGWSFLSNLNYTGIRYTNNSESGFLNSFLLLDVALSKKMQLQKNTVIFSLRSDNATNVVYQTMAFHAMPPRGYTFSFNLIIP